MATDNDLEEKRKGGIAYAAALSIFFSVAGCAGLGWLIDRAAGTKPWLMLGGIVLGSIVGLYQFIKLTSKL